MKIKIYTDSIDELETALLVLPYFSDTLPLKGALGLLDWRLNGFISGLFVKKRLESRYFEKVLIPPLERVPSERTLMVCMGRESELDGQQMGDFAFRVLETAHKINFSNFVLSFPVEFERSAKVGALVESFFKGIDKFAVKIGACDFLDNLRITFCLDKGRFPKTLESLGKYLSSRKASSQALINA